jgi:hypothetical protein
MPSRKQSNYYCPGFDLSLPFTLFRQYNKEGAGRSIKALEAAAESLVAKGDRFITRSELLGALRRV